MANRAPNWGKWLHIPELELWQAAALSLDIDPDKAKSEFSWKAGARVSNEGQEFDDRLDVIRANVGHGLTIRGSEDVIDPDRTKIALTQFAVWARSLGWGIPDELGDLASSEEGREQGKREVSLDLEGKKLATAYKLILGLAITGFRYDPAAARSDAPRRISEALAIVDIGVTDDTVREWLQKASEALGRR